MSVHSCHRVRWGGVATFAVALLAHAAVVINYIRVLPACDWPDAPAHMQYVRAVAAGRLPERVTDASWDLRRLEELKRRHFRGIEAPDDPAIAGFTYENNQPPLYYLAAGAVYRVTGRLWDVRLLNLAVSCAAIVLLGLLAQRLFPGQPLVTAGAVLFAALHPMRAYIAGSIGNDPLSELLFTAFALALVRKAAPWKIGVLAGLGLLTKVHLLLMLPLYGAFLLCEGRRDTRGLLKAVGLAAGITVLMALPWLWRNVMLNGWLDPLALRAGSLGSGVAALAAFGRENPTLTWTGPHGVCAFAVRLYLSWWGVFGWMSMFAPTKIVGCYVLLTLLPLAGLCRVAAARGWRLRLDSPSARAMAWLLLALLCHVAALVVYSRYDYQPQGRYLFTVFAATALLFGLGWRGMPVRWARVGLGGAVLLLAGMNVYLCHATIPWYLAP